MTDEVKIENIEEQEVGGEVVSDEVQEQSVEGSIEESVQEDTAVVEESIEQASSDKAVEDSEQAECDSDEQSRQDSEVVDKADEVSDEEAVQVDDGREDQEAAEGSEDDSDGNETEDGPQEVVDADGGEDSEQEQDAEEDSKEVKIFGVVEEGVEPTVESVVEAILFASDEPVTPKRLVDIVEVGGVKEIREAVKKLNDKYREMNSAFRVEEIAGGLQMMTLSNYNHWLKKMIRVRGDSKLTQAALETLAIIAYKQPIIRADVEAIRGVGSGEMIRSLMYKGLVKISGRAEVLGRPLLYGTTKKFLEVFGLGNLKDLPKIEELKKPE